jgi:hypothetical protein
MTHFAPDPDTGQPIQIAVDHDRWVIVEADCDLAWRAMLGSSHLVELRPVWTENPPSDWGVRSGRFLLDRSDGAHVSWDSPSLKVTSAVVAMATRTSEISPQHALRFRTWLRLRSSRPAVPAQFVDLAQALADRFKARRRRSEGAILRDILARFWTDEVGRPQFDLTALLPSDAAVNEAEIRRIRAWLYEVTEDLPETLGIGDDFSALSDAQISLARLEQSYSLDLSTISWPQNTPGPVGQI